MSGISSEHAVKRIQQLTGYCLGLVKELEDEAEHEAQEARDFGLDVETRSVAIQSVGDSVHSKSHEFLRFYSQFL